MISSHPSLSFKEATTVGLWYRTVCSRYRYSREMMNGSDVWYLIPSRNTDLKQVYVIVLYTISSCSIILSD